jgi:hypothetical protein
MTNSATSHHDMIGYLVLTKEETPDFPHLWSLFRPNLLGQTFQLHGRCHNRTAVSVEVHRSSGDRRINIVKTWSLLVAISY